MKKIYAKSRIYGSTDPGNIHPALESLEEAAYRAGYNLVADGTTLDDVLLELTAKDANMPVITIWLDKSNKNKDSVITYECTVDFPYIDTRNLEFSDDAEAIIKGYVKAGKLVTYMMSHPIDLSMWEE